MSNAAARIVCIESTEEIKLRHPETWGGEKSCIINLHQLSGVKIDTVFKHVAPRSADIDQCCCGLREGQASLAEEACCVCGKQKRLELKTKGVPRMAP